MSYLFVRFCGKKIIPPGCTCVALYKSLMIRLATLSILGALMMPVGSFAQFGAESLLDHINNVNYFTIGDLDNDGKKDLVTNEVKWYRQLEGEQFGEPRYIGASGKVLLADLDGNDWLDVIVSSTDSLPVWYPNTGGGIFGNPVVISTQQYDILGFADYDGDGDLDIVGNFGNSSWFENMDGSGNFSAPQTIYDSAKGILSEDLDGDGDIDILLPADDGIAWLENTDGQGAFSPGTFLVYDNNASFKQCLLQDMDLDGDKDLVAYESSIIWYERTGSVQFSPIPKKLSNYSYSEFYISFVNDDPLPDVVYHNNSKIYWAQSQPPYGGINVKEVLDVDATSQILVTDLNNDGKDDLLFLGPNNLFWLSDLRREATGEQVFAFNSQLDAFVTTDLDLGDVDGDGYVDLLSSESPNMAWYRQLPGKKLFSERKDIAQANFANLKLLDWDSDSDLDILAGDGQELFLLENQDGAGQFSHKIQLIDSLQAADSLRVLFEDFDLDGDVDVVGLRLYEPGLIFWKNDGQGHFQKHQIADFDGAIRRLACADAGNDGDLDLFFSGYVSDNYYLFFIENDGGTFLSPDTVTNDENLYNFAFVADLNNDGNVSVLSFDSQTFPASLHEFRYSPVTNSMEDAGTVYVLPPTIPQPTLLATEDVDGDGDRDLILNRLGDYRIRWAEYDNGVFTGEQVLISEVSYASKIFWNDIDNDGDQDICVFQIGTEPDPFYPSIYTGRYLVWFENTPAGFNSDNGRVIGPTEELKYTKYGDMDADGDLDLVGFNKDHFTWMENYDGAGHFASGQNIGFHLPAGYYGETIHLYDADNDNDLDLLFFQYEPLFFRNNGNGTFTQSTVNAVNNYGLITADVNGDTYPDLIGYNYWNKQVIKYLYQPGIGTYAAGVTVGILGNFPQDVIATDLDRDGDLDLVVAVENNATSESNDLYYLLNNGAGNFSPPALLLPNSWQKSKLAVGDINQDGWDDLITGIRSSSNQLVWFTNVPAPGFLGEGNNVTAEAFWGKTFVADMDTDGDPDLINNNHWFENNGDGEFSQAHQVASSSLFTDFSETLTGIADLDADGTPDLLMDNLWINMPSAADGNRERLKKVAGIGNSLGVRGSVLPFDADLDGDLDLLAGQGARILWYENIPANGNAQFQLPVPLLDIPNGGSISQLYSHDMDADGLSDLLFASTGPIGYFKTLPNGTFSAPIVAFTANSLNVNAIPQVADFDGDGDGDFLAMWGDIYECSGEGGYYFTQHDLLDGGPNGNLRNGDGDGDGDLDVFSGYSDPVNNVWWSRNDGNLQFAAPTIFASPSVPINFYLTDYHILDLDNDGKTDVVIIMEHYNFHSKRILWMKNLDDGSNFQEIYLINGSGIYPNMLSFSDADNNHLPDIAYHLEGEKQLRWLLQLEQGVFTDTLLAMEAPANFTNIENLLSADLDGDADLDLVYTDAVAAFDDKTIFWRENLQNNPVISGQCFLDENENAQFDPGELPLLDCHTVLDPKALLSFPDDRGVTKYFVELGDWELGYVTDNLLWELTTDTAAYQIHIDTLPFAEHKLFGLKPLKDTLAFAPHLVSATTRCNFTVPFWLSVKNSGTRRTGGQIKLLLDPLVAWVESVSQTPDSVNGDTLTWDFSELPPSYSHKIELMLKMPDESFAGDYIHFQTLVSVFDSLADSTLVFTHHYSQEIRCAIDPNDKLVNPARDDVYPENYTLFGERLEYTIRFQNTGNDTAFNIRLTDQLDANLDWTTFQPIAASHYYEATLNENGLLSVFFRNILLPDTVTNEPASHGFFTYVIFPKTGLPEETTISNVANIYFDYNQPIITNVTTNVLVTELPTSNTGELDSLPQAKAYPNPVRAGSLLKIDSELISPKVTLTDVLGRVVLQKNANGKITDLRLPDCPSGIYWLSFESGFHRRVAKLVVIE